MKDIIPSNRKECYLFTPTQITLLLPHMGTSDKPIVPRRKEQRELLIRGWHTSLEKKRVVKPTIMSDKGISIFMLYHGWDDLSQQKPPPAQASMQRKECVVCLMTE